jgi:hypothetical protein
MNAFQLRFAILNTAREMLEAEYYAKKSDGEVIEWPTVDRIIERAKVLNSFVSEK